MKLSDIIKYLESDEALEGLYDEYDLDRESETIGIYMKDSLDIDSELFFFDTLEVGDGLKIDKDGVTYFSLFSPELGVEFYSYFDDFFKAEKYTERQKAQRLLEYIINDA
jgi:hypothetical protein